MSRRLAILETALVFLVFFIQGAWPVPDVNEPTYLGKAIHFWNPQWAPNDFFLDSANTHTVFYVVFGWVGLFLSIEAMAWTGRLVVWGLMAWSWRRLSFAVVPRPWLSVLTAALFAMLLQRFHMAGEWVFGGVEAKGFAFVAVFLALEALVRGSWNRAWVLLGVASAFHVLVGGWSAVAVGIGWLVEQRQEAPSPSLRSMLPGLLSGMALSLPGLLPPLVANWGVDSQTASRASEIYVYERLRHHLDPWQFPFWGAILPFTAICVVWLALRSWATLPPGWRRLARFVDASILIGLAGLALALLEFVDRAMAARLLRFYWFRGSDFAVPLGLALLVPGWLTGANIAGGTPAPQARRPLLTALIVLAALHVVDCGVLRLFSTGPAKADRLPRRSAWEAAWTWAGGPQKHPIFPRQPRGEKMQNYDAWTEACVWVAQSETVPSDAIFITPRMAQTFKWHAHRGEVANWKDVPQDAVSIVGWWQRIQDIHATGLEPPDRWYQRLEELGPERLWKLAGKYGADYVIMPKPEAPLPFEEVYNNEVYVIYRLR